MTDGDMAATLDGWAAEALLGGRVRLLQPHRGYRAAIDPVLLAAAVPARDGEAVLELGAGAGAATLCLAARVPGCRLTALERQPEAAAALRQGVALNGWQDRIAVLEGDLRAPPPGLPLNGFDRVLMNPPFYEAGRHTPSPAPGKAASHGEGEATLADWVRAALRHLKGRGTLTLVHRADRLDAILAALHGRFGGIVVFPLWPRAGQPAKRVIVHAVRDGRGPLRLASGLVLHGAEGRFTPAADDVLLHAAPLEL